MPELPEVEIHARLARRWLAGRRIREYRILDPRLDRLRPPEGSPAHWGTTLPGRRVAGVRRLAKYLLIDLDGAGAGEEGYTLVLHLGMTGRLRFEPYAGAPPPRAARLEILLEEGGLLRLEDVRRFGRVWVARTPEVLRLPELAGLGPDALQDPPTAERLRDLTRGSRRAVKALLMDQRRIGGLGNIHAAEILFRAGIAPETPGHLLSEAGCRRLAETIPSHLREAIESESRRELLYLGEKGAENRFSIYGREGQPCPRCGTAVARRVLAGRGTYSCPACQPATGAAPPRG